VTKGKTVTDVALVLALIAFFAGCAGFVMVCERIIGPDPTGRAREDTSAAIDEAAA
jgi:hypothetical protein